MERVKRRKKRNPQRWIKNPRTRNPKKILAKKMTF
jgi:hypothetical protein